MRASDVVKDMFLKNGRRIVVTTLRGNTHVVNLTFNDRISSTTGLRNQELSLAVFDIVVDFLKENRGFAPKGAGRNDKVGFGKCTLDTICGQIATKYYGHKIGESTFDPVFIVCAILEQAGICENQRGYLRLIRRDL